MGGGKLEGRSGWRWLAGVVAGVVAASTQAAGAPRAPTPSTQAAETQRALASAGCRFELVGTGKVAKVIDGRSFVLDDGREVRLAAVEVPLPPPPGESALQAAPGETAARAAASEAARAALAAMLDGATVELRHQGMAVDRYGRILAHAYLAGDGAARSAAAELIERGHARVSAEVGDTACARELLSRERVARTAKLGLWSDPYYVPMGAESGAELLAGRGRFTVVEGKVLSVRESGGTIYMNFGRRWSQALTVTISKRDEGIFTGAGLAPKKLENRRVRVRGFVEERNGPRIEATRPEQIEIAEAERN